MNNSQEKLSLPTEYIQFLKKSAHHLKPVVQFGKKGINEALIHEINQALDHHELIKIRVAKEEKEAFQSGLPMILAQTDAHHISTIGNVAILFKKKKENSQYEL